MPEPDTETGFRLETNVGGLIGIVAVIVVSIGPIFGLGCYCLLQPWPRRR